MSDRTLRWGILGTARINRSLIPPLRSSGRNRLVAVASRSPQKAQNYARDWNIPRAMGSYQEMLNDPAIDVIYNSLPNSLHAEWTLRAAEAGKHVLCEKPLALSVEDVDAMADASRRAGVVIAEAFMYRHHPQTLKVKELVESGAIGELQFMRGNFSFSLDRPQDVRLMPELGGGSIWDIGCYPISYARYIAGTEPVEVFGWQKQAENGIDLVFVGQLRFPGDIYAQFDSSFITPYRVYMELVGSQGNIQVPMPFSPGVNETILLRLTSEVKKIEIPGQELYLGEVEDLADAVLLGRQPRLSLADSRHNVATIVALLESAQKGQPVPCS